MPPEIGRIKTIQRDDAGKGHIYLVGGNSNMFYFYPDPWRNDPILTPIF